MTYTIGIDPGCGKRTGFAVIRNGQLIDTQTTTAQRVVWLATNYYKEDAVVVVEAETAMPYQRRGESTTATWGRARGRMMNHGASEGIVMALRSHGYRVERARAPRKLTPDLWRALFKWEGRLPSEHARTAARIAESYIQEKGEYGVRGEIR